MVVDITKHCIFTSPKPNDPPMGLPIGFTFTASTNVVIGGIPMPSLTMMAIAAATKLAFKGFMKAVKAVRAFRAVQIADDIAKAVNPRDSNINCGNIIDAVMDRLDGANPNAVAPDRQDGFFWQIEARHNTTMTWGNTIQSAYNVAQRSGPGSILIVGIDYGAGNGSHVVTMANIDGKVSIIEGQTWGPGARAGAITDPAAAQARYNPANVGVAVVPRRRP
jgi:hypothetical protein